MKKRLISLLLAFSMVISLLPVGAFADNDTVNIWITDNYPDASQKGTQAVSRDQTGGDWFFTPSADPAKPEDGVLTLCGNGKSYNFGSDDLDCKVVIYSRTSRCSTIEGGYFNNSVECQGGVEIRGGMYRNSVTLTPHTNEYTNFITNGTFYGDVSATGTTITNGSFFGNVTLNDGTTIYNGTARNAVPRFFSNTVVKNLSGVIAGGCFCGPVQGEVTCGIFQEKPAQIAPGSHTWTLTTKSGTYGFNISSMTLTSGSPLYVVGTYPKGNWNDLAYDPTDAKTAKYINGSTGSAYHNGTQYSIMDADGGDAGTLYLCNSNSSYRSNFYLFEIKGDATVAFEEILNPLVIDESGYPDLSKGGTEEVTASQTNHVWAFTPSTTGNPADGTLTLYKGEFNLQNPVACKVALSGGTGSSNYASITGGIFKNTVTVNENSFLEGGIYADDVVLSSSNTFLHGGLFAKLPTGLNHSNHYWTLTASGEDRYTFNDALTLSADNPLYLASNYANEGYHSFTVKITGSDLKYANRIEIKKTATTILENGTRCGTIKRVTGGYSFDLGASGTVLLQSSLLPLETDETGYPNGTEGGKIAKSGDGWSFTPSTTGNPADGVLTLTGSDMDLGSNPVACKVVLKGASDNSYASIASGTFNNTVTLERYAALKNGTYNGAVSSNGTSYIYGGTFNNTVDFDYGFICGGTFNKPVSSNLNITNGIFMDTVTLKYPGILVGGIYAGDVKLSNEFRHGGLFAKLPDDLRADNLVWTLTTNGDDSYTFGGVLTLDKDHPLYLASSYTAQYASSNTTKYPITSSAHDLKYANQIALSSTGDTSITADGTPCGTITAGTDGYRFKLTKTATVLLQSALDPLVIDETGYPKGTEGGTQAKSGEGWSYAPYMAYGPDAAKGLLTLSSGTFDAINSDHTAQCDVKVNADVTLSSGSFAGTVTCYGILGGGTFSRKVNVAFPNGVVFSNYPTIQSGTFTETSEVTVDSIYTYIKDGTFNGTVTNKGNIKGGTFYGTVTNEGTIKRGIFYGSVTNTTDKNLGGIQNGTFTGEVTNSGYITNGTFGGTVTNNNTVAGGTFNGEVLNGAIGTLKGGTFTGPVTNSGRIVNSDSTYTGPVTNRGIIESGTFEGSVKNYGTLMGGEFSGEVWNNADPEDTTRSGIIRFSTEDGVYAPPLFTETSTVTNIGSAKIQDGTFLGTVIGMVEGGVYVHKPESTTSTISRMTYRYQGSDGNGKTGALTINYKIEDAAYVVNSDTTHVFVTLTSNLKNINGQTFSGNTCSPKTWALYGKLPENAEQIILNKATFLSIQEGDCTVNLPGDEDHKVVYDGQPHEATIELVSDGLDYLLDKYETVPTEDGGRALKVYYRNLATDELKEEAPIKIGTYQVLYKEGTIYFSTNWMFKITENSHSVTVTDGFIVKVEHPGAVNTDDTTGDDTTEEPISTATVQYGDTVTVTIDASKFPSGMVFDRWETTPVDLPLTPADGESYKTVTFTMPAEDVTLRAVPCTVEEKAASGGSSPLGTAALVVVGGAAAGVLVWQGYELGTELYLHSVLPSGVAIPETRGQLAVVLWQAAGSPAPAAPLAPDAADTQKAMAWVVEHALLEDKTGNFDPREPVNKTEVIRAWNQLNKQGLAQQAK